MGKWIFLIFLPQINAKCSSNAEEMLNEEGTPKTSHTTNLVPFVMANAPKGWSLKKKDGVLGDVAPTVLAAMGLDQPEEMTGHSLLQKA
jgi:2,3-bisphosphoglycerate-independent phosphoglycerate mutase